MNSLRADARRLDQAREPPLGFANAAVQLLEAGRDPVDRRRIEHDARQRLLEPRRRAQGARESRLNRRHQLFLEPSQRRAGPAIAIDLVDRCIGYGGRGGAHEALPGRREIDDVAQQHRSGGKPAAPILDFRDQQGAAAERRQHGGAASLDALRQRHLLLPRQELGRGDLAQVVAQRVAGATDILGEVAARQQAARHDRGLAAPRLARPGLVAGHGVLGRLPVNGEGAGETGPHVFELSALRDSAPGVPIPARGAFEAQYRRLGAAC